MNFLRNLPTSATALMLVMGALAPILLFVCKDNSAVINSLITALYLTVGAVAVLGVLFFERSKKSKSKDFAKEVESNAASAEGIKDPQKIAQMDHMRKEFQRGIDIYKKLGKDLYSLPWYVVVGESESGKTEMLRRSEIGFPDKLQDRWQGSGGTLSMHWWFTNKAVILDTAGRLFVTEGAESGQNQWVNFLQMLKKNRPDCPINGLILVIPSNRLLTHPNPDIEAVRAAELDRNAGQIAQQMETLQSELGVRFPVYILITKMDKLNGFREFFGKLDKPEDRYQILGWSNPAPLGSAFEPQSVAEYMRSVADRLNRRMMSELRGVEPENPAGLRLDEVDALYAFPTAFESMTGKLTRYLRHIFTTDEWSAKPPFLRGLYFTSALQQGMVLDEALAAAMGVPLEKMDSTQEDDGLSLSRNRTYFVRDLFLDKIFSEKGLVTTAGKIRSSISGWKLWVPAAILLMVAGLGILGLLAKTAPTKELELWEGLWASGGAQGRIKPLVSADQPGDPNAVSRQDAERLLRRLATLGQEVQGKPKFGWFFAPAQWFDGDLAKDRQLLYADLVAESLARVENSLIAKYQAQAGSTDWEKQDWAALHALILLRAPSAEMKAGELRLSKDGAAFPVHALLAALFKAAGIAADPTPLRDSLNHAQNLAGNDFAAKLKSWRKGDLSKDVLHKVVPPAGSADRDKQIRDLNDLVETIRSAAENRDLKPILDLPAMKFDQSVLESTFGEGEGKTDDVKSGAVLATSRAKLEGVLSRPDIAKIHDYPQPGSGPEQDAIPLAKHEKIRDHVLRMLEVFKNPDELVGNLDSFSLSPDQVLEKEDCDDKDISKILGSLETLKKPWFEQEFAKKHLKNHLCAPVVRGDGVKPASAEALRQLWEIVALAKKLKVSKLAGMEKLESSFGIFFHAEKIAAEDFDASIRSCTVKPVKKRVGETRVFAVKWEGELKPPTWNFFDAIPEADMVKTIRLDKDLTFTRADNGRDANPAKKEVKAWTLPDRLTKDGNDDWIFATDLDVDYKITIKGADLNLLEKRPTIQEFEQP